MTLRHASPPASKQVVALDYEIAQEQASALGRLGRALESALAALAEHEGTGGQADMVRAQLVQTAGEALWSFLVQREACGLRDPRPIICDYRVPIEVQNRSGTFAVRPRRRSR